MTWFRRWLDRLDEKRMARKYEREICKPLTSDQMKALHEWFRNRDT